MFIIELYVETSILRLKLSFTLYCYSLFISPYNFFIDALTLLNINWILIRKLVIYPFPVL